MVKCRMKSREEHIDFEMQYCQHYGRGKGADMICKAGMDLKTMQRVATEPKGIKWGPCIEGHTLPDPKAICPHWIRRTREMGEKRAANIERTLKQMELVTPVVNEWRKKQPIGKRETIECPACKGRLHLSQAAYNGHVHAKCETEGCVAWME
jgi:hypothetical protein